MAELSVDFTNDLSRYEQVLFQRDKDVLDGELNEIGRLIRVRRKRSNVIQDSDSAALAGREGYPRCSGLQLVPNGAANDEVLLQPVPGRRAFVEFRGYTFEIAGPITFTCDTTGVDRFQQIYMTVTETEISAAGDPSIAVSQLGETARRIRLTVNFGIGAINTNTAGALNTVQEPWEAGGVKAGVFGLVKRVAAVTTAVVNDFEIFTTFRAQREYADFMALSQKKTILRTGNFGAEVGSVLVKQAAPNDLVFDNVGVILPPGFYDNASGAIMHYVLNGVFTLANPGDVLIIRGMASSRPGPGSSFGTDIQAVVGPGPNEVEADVVSWEQYVHGVAQGSVDGFEQVLPIAVRLNAGPNWLLADGRTIGHLQGSVGTNVDTDGVLYFDAGNQLIDHHDGLFTLGFDRYKTPRVRDRRLPATGFMQLLTEEIVLPANYLGAGNQPVFRRVYSANALDRIADSDGSLRRFTGRVETVNARYVGNIGNEWEADANGNGFTAHAIYHGIEQNFGIGPIFLPVRVERMHFPFSYGDPWGESDWQIDGSGHGEIEHFNTNGTRINTLRGSVNGFEQYSYFGFSGFGDPGIGPSQTPNQMTAKHMAKAWCFATIDAAVSPVVVTPHFGVGFSGVASYTSAAGNSLLSFSLAPGLAWATSGEYTVHTSFGSVIPFGGNGNPTRVGTFPGSIGNGCFISRDGLQVTGNIRLRVIDTVNSDNNPIFPASLGGGGLSFGLFIHCYGAMTSPP